MSNMKDKQANKTDEKLSLDALQDVSGGYVVWGSTKPGGPVMVQCEKCSTRYSYSGGTAPEYHKCPTCGTIN